MSTEHEKAVEDVERYGCGFLVDGVRVAPPRVLVVGGDLVPAKWRDLLEAAEDFRAHTAGDETRGGAAACVRLDMAIAECNR